MKYTLFLEDETGKKVDFNNDPEIVKLIAENIDCDTMNGVMKEYLPENISTSLFKALNAHSLLFTARMELEQAK